MKDFLQKRGENSINEWVIRNCFFDRFGKAGYQVICLNKIFPQNPHVMASDPGEVNNDLPLAPLHMETAVFPTTLSLPTGPFRISIHSTFPLRPAVLLSYA